MANDKSILEKFTDTVKDIASIAADAANQALSAEQPAFKADEQAVIYVPLAADGFVSDPMMIAPIAPVRKKKRAAAKPSKKKGSKRAAKKAVKKTARKTAKKPAAKGASKGARKAVKKSPKKANRKSASKTAGKAKEARRKTGGAR
jgi:hypothetical protein